MFLTVKQYQMNLQFLNFYMGKIDGIKGKLTKQAIIDFQSYHGLKVDGIYGSQTNTKLIAVIKEKQRELGVFDDGIAGPKTRQADIIRGFQKVEHFQNYEFSCPCCGLNRTESKLLQVLELIRSHFGDKPVIITSGTRCEKHNKDVGGVKTSRHIIGKACDFYINGIDKKEILSYTESLVASNLLRYTYTNDTNMKNAVHIDIL